MEFLECRRVQKLLEGGAGCEMAVIEKIEGLDAVFEEIFALFIVFMMVILPIGYFLAMMSLRPMRESIETIDSFINGIVHA